MAGYPIIDSESKHTIKTFDAFRSPLAKGIQHGFGVRVRLKPMTFFFEFFSKFAVIIDLAIKKRFVQELAPNSIRASSYGHFFPNIETWSQCFISLFKPSQVYKQIFQDSETPYIKTKVSHGSKSLNIDSENGEWNGSRSQKELILAPSVWFGLSSVVQL